MYCKCGCGRKTKIAPRNRKELGHVKGQPIPFIHGHQLNARWKGHRQYLEEDRGYETLCWIWQGYCHPSGYGEISGGKGSRIAHRRFYEDHVGPIPKGHRVHHRCEVRPCVNPEHLEAVSPKVHGERHARVTDEQVREMRRRNAAGESVKNLAAEYGLSYQYGWFVIRGHRRASA